MSRIYELSIKDLEILVEFHLSQFFIYVHQNLFAPQTLDLLEKLALIFLYNFHRDHILLTLTIKSYRRKSMWKHKTRVYLGVQILVKRTILVFKSWWKELSWCSNPGEENYPGVHILMKRTILVFNSWWRELFTRKTRLQCVLQCLLEILTSTLAPFLQ